MPFLFAPAPLGGGLILRIKTVRRFRHLSLHSAAEIKKRNRKLALLYSWGEVDLDHRVGHYNIQYNLTLRELRLNF